MVSQLYVLALSKIAEKGKQFSSLEKGMPKSRFLSFPTEAGEKGFQTAPGE